MTDARGATATYDYYSRRLVKSITYSLQPDAIIPPGSTIPLPAPVSFEYDPAGNRTKMTETGFGSVIYKYDQLSRLTAETRHFNELESSSTGGDYTLSYDYNLAGAVKSVTDPFGSTVSYAYDDQAGRLRSVTGSGYGSVTQFASNLQYRAWGALKSLTYGNNLPLSQSYDGRLQLTSFQVGAVMSAEFQYHPDGHIRYAKDNTNPTMDRAYAYDHAGRLSEGLSGAEARDFVNGTQGAVADGVYRQSYQYDVWDNLTGRPVNRFWSRDNPFTATYVNDRQQGLPYDAEGHVLRDFRDNRWHTYDAAGRKIKSQESSRSSSWALAQAPGTASPSTSASGGGLEPDMPPGGYYTTTTLTIAQSYDGEGRSSKRVETTVQSTPFYQPVSTQRVDYYLRSSVLGGQVIAELNSQGEKSTTKVYAGALLIAEQQFYYQGEQSLSWQYGNPVTGTSVEQNASSGQTQQAEYDTFGLELGDSDPYLQSEEPDYAALSGGTLYREGGNPFDGGGGCQWNGLPIDCSFLGFVVRTQQVERVEINARNAPAGFGLGVSVQQRWVNTYGRNEAGRSGERADGSVYITTNHYQSGYWETVLTGLFNSSILQLSTPDTG